MSRPVDGREAAARGDPLRFWKRLALGSALVIVLSIPLYAVFDAGPGARGESRGTQPTFVGRERCRTCHESAYVSWEGSHHDHSMAEANEQTVLGDFDDAHFEYRGVASRFYRRDGGFFVHTEGPDGEPGEFEIAYTFGVEPLQQYLVRFPRGRLQALSIAWDTERQRWFHLYPDQQIAPDDWLHWTRAAQTWNGMCAECHSTDLRKAYDPDADAFDTTWSEIDVSCEACHGPASRHVAWAEIPPMARPEIPDYGLVVPTAEATSREQVELCAPCHSRRSELGDYDHTRVAVLDNQLPALLAEELYHPDGQIQGEVYVWGSFVQSKMYKNGVRCSDCHDVHSLALRAEGNALCLQCHRADAYDTYDHHFHKKIHEGNPSDGALCVKCHMPERPYMVVDWRADHSLRVPRPDLSQEIGTPNACTQAGCHDDRPLQWSVDAFRKWYGIARKPHYGTILAAARDADPEARDALIRLAGDPLFPTLVRATALSLLDRYPGAAADATLRAALLDDEALMRHTAVQELSLADPQERVSLLAPLLFDSAKAVRLAALAQLAGTPEHLFEPYQRDAYREVEAEYVETMQYSLDFAFAGMNLGTLYARQGRPREAARYYRRAIGVDDLFSPAKINLAILLSGEGENREAERLLREVVEAYPEHSEAAYLLSLLLVELGEPIEALVWMQRAADGAPRNPRVRYNLGLLQQSLGHDVEAETALRAAVELAPHQPDYLYALADHYLKRGRFEEALALAERLIELAPELEVGSQLKAYLEAELARAGRP
jgi:predicted CXXCH cytochrome family protein